MTERRKVVTPPFRVSFPSVFQKSSYQGSKPKYSVTAIFHPDRFTDRDRKAFVAMEALLEEACQFKFNKPVKSMPRDFKYGLRPCDEKSHMEGYNIKGGFFASLSSLQQPQVIDREKQPILAEEGLYPGCWARATVTGYGYDNVGRGVAFGLHNLQFLGDDANFTGRMDAEDDFDDDADQAWSGAGVAGAASKDLAADDPLG